MGCPQNQRAPRSKPGATGDTGSRRGAGTASRSAARPAGSPAQRAGIGLLFLISNFLRLGAGFIAPRRVLDLRLTRLWLNYTLVTGVIAMGLVLALPALVTMLGARP
jgi:cytochrome c oxidase subunit I+III